MFSGFIFFLIVGNVNLMRKPRYPPSEFFSLISPIYHVHASLPIAVFAKYNHKGQASFLQNLILKWVPCERPQGKPSQPKGTFKMLVFILFGNIKN